MPLKKIAVLGLGKVGTLAAKLLHAGGFDVTGFDSRAAARDAAVYRAFCGRRRG